MRPNAKSGSRGKIQDRCCQGLIASAASQRRTVEAEIEATTPRRLASAASSGQLHLASGMSASAGSSQARAFTSATCTALNRRGRPVRGRSVKSGQPLLMAEPSPPLAHGVNVQPQVCGDGGIRPAVSGGQDYVGSDHIAVGSAGAVSADNQLRVLLGRQHNQIRGKR